jgi:3-deoxy-D-manno-octulosonic-acid transferase
MYSVPVVVGPHISVIRELVEEMRSRGGILEIATQADARLLIERLVSGEQGLQRVGGEGYKVWERHRGAAKRVVSLLSHE